MRQTFRVNTFETNSSSTHSCVICSKDEYDKFKDGELYLDDWNGKFYTLEEVKEEFKKESLLMDESSPQFDDKLHDYIADNYKTYDNWNRDYETDYTIRTVDGVDIVAICYYGYDG